VSGARTISHSTANNKIVGELGNIFSPFAKLNSQYSTKQKVTTALLAILMSIVGTLTVNALSEQQQNSGNNQSSQSNISGQTNSNGSATNNIPPSNDGNKANGTSSNSSSTSVTINGKSVAVPQNGSYDTTVDGVRISGNNFSQSTTSSGGSVSNNSSARVNIQSQ
jgi:hypothetical protein